MNDRACIFCLVFVIILNYILRVLPYKSLKHTVIKACNNKIEQGEKNVLFNVCVCVCSYLGGNSFITITVNSQCPTRLEAIMVVNYRLTHSGSELSGFTCTSSLTMNEK